jgi:hypothetical protein
LDSNSFLKRIIISFDNPLDTMSYIAYSNKITVIEDATRDEYPEIPAMQGQPEKGAVAEGGFHCVGRRTGRTN